MADQSETPYLDAVVSYVARNPGRFHIPGHKGTGADPGLIEALGEAGGLTAPPPSGGGTPRYYPSSRRASRGSTSDRSRRPSSARSILPPTPGARNAAGSWST